MSQVSSYSEGFRRQAVQKMYNRGEKPIAELARELGCSHVTLYKWARSMTLQPVEKSSAEWTAKERLAAIIDYHAVAEDQKGVWLRQKGLTGEMLEHWEESALGGLSSRREDIGQGRMRKAIRNLEHQLRRKERKLEQRNAIIDVQKKVLELFKDEADESPDLQTGRTFAKE